MSDLVKRLAEIQSRKLKEHRYFCKYEYEHDGCLYDSRFMTLDETIAFMDSHNVIGVFETVHDQDLKTLSKNLHCLVDKYADK